MDNSSQGSHFLAEEASEIEKRYARRSDDLVTKSVFHPARLESNLEKQRALIGLLRRNLSVPISKARILEVGSGHGDNLQQFILWGASPENLVGNDLLQERIEFARARLPPATELIAGDALKLDLKPETFDVVMASTVFSSILSDEFRTALAEHMWKLVKPGGGVLWYDFMFDNPRNPDVRKVTRKQVRALFPEARADLRRITLAPPIAREVSKIHPNLYGVVNLVRPLRTHLSAWLAKAE